MSERLVVLGAAGFGRETLDVLEAINQSLDEPQFDVIGVLDDGPSEVSLERLAARNVTYLGTTADWLASGDSASYLLGVGDPKLRRMLDSRFRNAGLVAATAVHPTVVLGTMVTVGRGAVICAGAQIATNTRLGEHVHLNRGANVGHDCLLDDFVSINPGAIISGEVTIESGVLIGAGAVVLFGLTVGRDSLVGASACVVRDVVENTVVKGVPAR